MEYSAVLKQLTETYKPYRNNSSCDRIVWFSPYTSTRLNYYEGRNYRYKNTAEPFDKFTQELRKNNRALNEKEIQHLYYEMVAMKYDLEFYDYDENKKIKSELDNLQKIRWDKNRNVLDEDGVKPCETEKELQKIADKNRLLYQKIDNICSPSNKKTIYHTRTVKAGCISFYYNDTTLNLSKGLNFFRMKKQDAKGRATNKGETATHYANTVYYEFRGTHSVCELKRFCVINGYKPKQKDKYENLKNWLFENLYKKN